MPNIGFYTKQAIWLGVFESICECFVTRAPYLLSRPSRPSYGKGFHELRAVPVRDPSKTLPTSLKRSIVDVRYYLHRNPERVLANHQRALEINVNVTTWIGCPDLAILCLIGFDGKKTVWTSIMDNRRNARMRSWEAIWPYETQWQKKSWKKDGKSAEHEDDILWGNMARLNAMRKTIWKRIQTACTPLRLHEPIDSYRGLVFLSILLSLSSIRTSTWVAICAYLPSEHTAPDLQIAL